MGAALDRPCHTLDRLFGSQRRQWVDARGGDRRNDTRHERRRTEHASHEAEYHRIARPELEQHDPEQPNERRARDEPERHADELRCVAPSVIRIPSSRTRRVTANAITAYSPMAASANDTMPKMTNIVPNTRMKSIGRASTSSIESVA